MKVVVFGEFPADSPRAHAINVTKTAGGFARLGHDVTLVCRAPEAGSSLEDLRRRYAEPGLNWKFASDDRAPSPAGGSLDTASGADVVYARSFHAAESCSGAGLATVLETHAHEGDTNPVLLRCLRLAAPGGPLRAVVTISSTLREYYISRGAAPGRVHVVPDGVDLDLFAPPANPPPPPWPNDGRPHAVYCGHLYEYKGIPTILDAAALLPDWSFDLVGGLPDDLARVRRALGDKRLSNVTLHGPRPHAEVPAWLWRADALLLPPLATDPSARWTSPVKLGEYLAAGPMIIASDIPGLRAWVDQPEVTWFPAGDAPALARALEASRNEPPALRLRRRDAARSRAAMCCYPERARHILEAVLKPPSA